MANASGRGSSPAVGTIYANVFDMVSNHTNYKSTTYNNNFRRERETKKDGEYMERSNEVGDKDRKLETQN